MQLLSVNNDYASGMRRLAAFFIDRILLSALLSFFLFRWWDYGNDWGWTYSNFHFGLQFWKMNMIREATIFLYYSLMESSKYQATLGKIVMGIKVVDHNNQRLQFPQALLRNLSKILSGFILLIGYIMIIFDDRKQGLHDKIADTFVLKA